MAEKIIRTIIQLRRDTEANWQSSEYIAKAAEPMITLDGEHKGHIKMGDGESLWSALPYITDGSGQPVTVQVDGTSIVDTEGVLGLDGFASATVGQQPRKAADGTLEWYTPDTSSVSGLQEAVGQLQTDVDALEAVVGNSGSGLVHDVANNTTLIESLTTNLADNYDTSAEVDEKIKSAISSTYKAAGSVASVDAITADAEHLGYVYNMSAEFTTTDAFVEGAGNTYPAGTNVVVVETNAEPATYGLDVLSGFVDLSDYATVEQLNTKTTQEVAGANGTSYVWNESSGGGARFVHNDGTESFVGVNDGGENGMVAQIYADKNVDGNWIGTRVNVYQKGAFYFNAEDKASGSYVADDPAHEIATLGDIPTYVTYGLTSLAEGSASANIETAIGSYSELIAAIRENKVIVDRSSTGGDNSVENTQVAIYANGNNVALNLIFYYGDNYKIFQIQNVGGTLALGVTAVQLARKGDIPSLEELEAAVEAVTATANGNKTIIDSLPAAIATGAEFSRDVYNNYIDIKVATKQEDGTYVASDENVRITIPGADMTHAGLMTADNINKLGTIQPNAEPNVINMIMIDGKKQPIAAKSVNISCAMTDGSEAGVVYSSADENKVSVDADGIMEVNNINVNKLVISEGDSLILDGGGAAD